MRTNDLDPHFGFDIRRVLVTRSPGVAPTSSRHIRDCAREARRSPDRAFEVIRILQAADALQSLCDPNLLNLVGAVESVRTSPQQCCVLSESSEPQCPTLSHRL